MQPPHWPWDVLELAPGADERSVRRAYARILKQQRPDTDPDAFQRLRGAYEFALALALSVAGPAIHDDALRADGAQAVVDPSGTAVETMETSILLATDDSSVAVRQDIASTPETPESAVQSPVQELDPAQEAAQRWRDFIATPMNYRTSADVARLFDDVVNFQVRDELEWQAVLYCLRDDAAAKLRVYLCEALEWRDEHRHLLQRAHYIAQTALARAFADDDYVTLSERYPRAMTLLEDGERMRRHVKGIVLDADLHSEMTALIATLKHYYQNVLIHRIDTNLIELWQRRQSRAQRITELVIPLTLQACWFGVLLAGAAALPGSGDLDWSGTWGPLAISLAFGGVMTYLLGASFVSTLTAERLARVQALRTTAGVRHGWIVVWVVTAATALATEPRGASASAVAAVLAVCTLWATIAHGLLPLKRVFFTPLTYAIALGFMGHWVDVSRPLWLLAIAHGVLITYFLQFGAQPLRAMIVTRPRVALGLSIAWFVAAAAFAALLLVDELRSIPYAWTIFSLMVPVVGTPLTGRDWSRIGGIPFPLQHLLFSVYWWTVGLVTPNLAAGFAILVVSIQLIVEMKRLRQMKALQASPATR